MKTSSIILVHVVTVTGALCAYDFLRGDRSPPSRSGAPRGPADPGALARRVERLERRDDPALEARLRSIEKTLRGLAAQRGPVPADDAPEPPAPASAPSPVAGGAEPSPEEIRRFRRLRDAVRREDAANKNRRRVERALDELSINLTPRQRERVRDAFAAFEPEIDRIWGEAKEQAREAMDRGQPIGTEELISATRERLRRGLAATLGTIVPHPADARAVSDALLAQRK